MTDSPKLTADVPPVAQDPGRSSDRYPRLLGEPAAWNTLPFLLPRAVGDLIDHLGPDPRQNIHTIVSQAPALLGSRCSIYQCCGTDGGFAATAYACNLPPGFEPETVGASPPWADFRPARAHAPAGTGQPAQSAPSAASAPPRDHDLKSHLTMPVFSDKVLLGAFSVFDEKERSFTPEEIYLMATLARMLALEEKRLERERERETGRRQASEKLRAERETAALARLRGTIAALQRRERELEAKIETLKEHNHALETLHRSHEKELSQLEERTLGGLREGIDPLVAGLKDTGLNEEQLAWVNRLEQRLIETAAPFAMHLNPQYQKLTPTEIKVAVLIRHGHTNKQIGLALGISSRTVEVHRNHIRRKLGLKRRSVNLKTHLQYLA